ncbi:uncharacterized protein LOC122617419 [Drosophila teissieri]|uniref:uncharacterized protein LOC122617419 n=1 Tax=Drosophila teissieri TaxID=7243 RepID=UPI001CBA18FD|nr:uncharacterized protein LOC122617419 [Drosophila teissieri]
MNCGSIQCSPLRTNSVVQRSLDSRLRRARAKECLEICFVKVVIILILFLDIWRGNSCTRKYWYYLVECFILAVMALSALLHFGKYLWLIFPEDQVIGTESQKRLLDGKEDTPFETVYARPALKSQINVKKGNEWKIQYWHLLFHQSWYPPMPPVLKQKSLNIAGKSEHKLIYDDEFITDIWKLPDLIKRAERERNRKIIMEKNIQTLENYNRKMIDDFFPLPVDWYIQNAKVVESNCPIKLMQWVANLRYWISKTILHRLVKEFEHVDKVAQELRFCNLKIGGTRLEMLRLLAEQEEVFVESCIPTLPTVLAFLNFSANQNYLVTRIKELAKGVYMPDYKWKLVKEQHLPTDTAILFHLFCVYMDSQLMPTPQEGGRRPFYSRYVVIRDKNPIEDIVSRVNNRANCAILATGNQESDPKFNFISGNEVQDCLHDRNNLFHVIIQFLTYMRDKRGSNLEGVSLGRSGINILDVIGDKSIIRDDINFE